MSDKNLEKNVETFKEQWNTVTQLSDNLKWAIFPVGNEEIEVQAAQRLLGMFESLDAFLYIKERDPEKVVALLEEALEKYKNTNKEKLALAAEEQGYTLRLGT